MDVSGCTKRAPGGSPLVKAEKVIPEIEKDGGDGDGDGEGGGETDTGLFDWLKAIKLMESDAMSRRRQNIKSGI